MAAPAHPPPQMMQGGPMMPPPGMAPPPWSQGDMNNMNGMNMQWQPPVSMPPPPGVMQPPPPPPGSNSQTNIPPLMPWMAGTLYNCTFILFLSFSLILALNSKKD